MEEKLREEYDKLIDKNSKSIKSFKNLKCESQSNRKRIPTIGIIGITIICWAIMFMLFFAIPIVMILFIVGLIIWLQKSSEFISAYEEKIIMPLMQKLDFVDKVDITKGLSHEIYKKANFRQNNYEDYSSSHYIKGHLENAVIEMSKATTSTTHEYKDSNGNSRLETKIIFGGLLVVVTLKDVITDGYIHIFNDKDDSKIIKFGKTESKVNMDSAAFEQEFDVYSTEPIKVFEILTSDIMQRFIDEKLEMNCKYDIAIMKNIIVMRVHNQKDILKMRTGKNATEPNYNIDLRDRIIKDVVFVNKISKFMNDLVNDYKMKNT